MSETEQERDDHEESERDDKVNEDSSGVPGSPGASNQTNVIPDEGGDDSDESDSDSDEECGKHANVFTGVNLDVSTNQHPLNSIIESGSITSHCSTSTAEDESDGTGIYLSKQGSSNRINSYRLAKVLWLSAKDLYTSYMKDVLYNMTSYIDAGNGRKNWRMLFMSFNRTWKENVTTILKILCQKPSRYIIIIIIVS